MTSQILNKYKVERGHYSSASRLLFANRWTDRLNNVTLLLIETEDHNTIREQSHDGNYEI